MFSISALFRVLLSLGSGLLQELIHIFFCDDGVRDFVVLRCGATSFLRNSDKIYEKKEMLLRRKSKLKHPQLSIWIAGDFFAQIHL